MNKIMVIVGTIFLIIAMIMQTVGIISVHRSRTDQINSIKDGDSDDYEDSMEDENWAMTELNIAMGLFMLSFIFLFIGFVLDKITHRPEYQPPPTPPRRRAPPRHDERDYDDY